MIADGGTGAETFYCVNWAVNGDNFQPGTLLLSGIFSTDTTYDAVKARATAVENAYTDLLKANSFRMPINEATVNTASYWNNYKAIIDVGVAKGMKVVVAYWAANTGIGMPSNINAWYTMWQTVIDAYINSPTVYFDIHNEPHGYSQQAWIQQVKDWMAKFPNRPALKRVARVSSDDRALADVVADCGQGHERRPGLEQVRCETRLLVTSAPIVAVVAPRVAADVDHGRALLAGWWQEAAVERPRAGKAGRGPVPVRKNHVIRAADLENRILKRW